MAMISAEFINAAINGVVEMGGTLVSEGEYERRVKICESCENYGPVKIAVFETIGCTLCGCPIATKPRYDTYYSYRKLKTIKAECPHKNGNKWAIVAEK
jgi:hypothetical protein